MGQVHHLRPLRMVRSDNIRCAAPLRSSEIARILGDPEEVVQAYRHFEGSMIDPYDQHGRDELLRRAGYRKPLFEKVGDALGSHDGLLIYVGWLAGVVSACVLIAAWVELGL